MPYTAEITSMIRPIKNTPDSFRLFLTIMVMDGSTEIKVLNTSASFTVGSVNINAIKTELLRQSKDEWDNFIAKSIIIGSQAYDDLLAEIKLTIENYLNQ